MIFVTRSTPFCRPAAVHKRPSRITTIIQKTTSPGFESIVPKTDATWSAPKPLNEPMALLYTNASIQPATTV